MAQGKRYQIQASINRVDMKAMLSIYDTLRGTHVESVSLTFNPVAQSVQEFMAEAQLMVDKYEATVTRLEKENNVEEQAAEGLRTLLTGRGLLS